MTNTSKIYSFGFFWMFLVIMPVIVPFYLDMGLSMHQVFQLQAIFGITSMAMDIPTGYLCDLWGRKKTLILGSFLAATGFTCMVFATSFLEFVQVQILIAFGVSFVSGADVSLLYDSVDKSHRKHGTQALANMQFFSVSGESVAAILGGLLVTSSFRIVLVANAIARWIPFFFALMFNEPAYEKPGRTEHLRNFRKVFRHIFLSHDRILGLTFINLAIWGLSTFFAVWIYQKYWQEIGISISYFGIIWAGYNLTVGVMGKQVHWLEHKIGPLPLLFFVGLAPCIAYFGMGISKGSIGVAFGFLFYLSRGIAQVLLKDALNWRTPSAFRATVNSLQSFFFRLGFAVFGPVIGILIDHYGVPTTLITLGTAFFTLFCIALIPLMIAIKNASPKYIPES